MERYFISQLDAWRLDKHRKPLLIEGARQVGKTWIAKEFGRLRFAKTAYVSLMDNERMALLFSGGISPSRIVPALSIESGVDITPEDTLIVLDEIQEIPRALTALKYFCEEAPEYAVLATGSSMGVTLHQGTSFPVGKASIQKLFPLTFCEFLTACGKKGMAELIRNADLELMGAFHDLLMEQLRYYMLVGGMPEVVAAFSEGLPSVDAAGIAALQGQLLRGYADDFSKHGSDMPRGLPVRLSQVWESIPSQLARENKRFLYGAVREGGRGRDFELAIQWLTDSSLVLKVPKANPPTYPLRMSARFDLFKLFLSDVGLLARMAGLDMPLVLEGNSVFGQARGCFAEQYVCQQLVAVGLEPFYWQADNSTAELDFLFQDGGRAVPVEVKSGTNLKAKSLAASIKRFGYDLTIRFSAGKPSRDGAIIDLPLYAVESLPKLLEDPERLLSR